MKKKQRKTNKWMVWMVWVTSFWLNILRVDFLRRRRSRRRPCRLPRSSFILIYKYVCIDTKYHAEPILYANSFIWRVHAIISTIARSLCHLILFVRLISIRAQHTQNKGIASFTMDAYRGYIAVLRHCTFFACVARYPFQFGR